VLLAAIFSAADWIFGARARGAQVDADGSLHRPDRTRHHQPGADPPRPLDHRTAPAHPQHRQRRQPGQRRQRRRDVRGPGRDPDRGNPATPAENRPAREPGTPRPRCRQRRRRRRTTPAPAGRDPRTTTRTRPRQPRFIVDTQGTTTDTAPNNGTARFIVSSSGEVTDLGPQALSNAATRAAYHSIIGQIPAQDAALQEQGASLYERAITAFKTRYDAKLFTRSLMADQESAALLPPAQSLRDLVIYYRGQGLSGDALLQELIGSSTRTNPVVDSMFGASP
jgi:hypothetical protein